MRRLILPLLAVVIAGTTFAQTNRLQLTTRITKQKYCGGIYTDMAMLRMAMQLTFTNKSSRPLILYRGSGLISYVLVAQNSQNILNKQYESNIHVGWITSNVRVHERTQPGKEFIILRAGESFQANGSIDIPVALEPGTQFLKSGEHVLQVIVETWPADEAQLGRLRLKWRRSGYLWGNNVRSEPMHFTVETRPNVVECT